MADKRRHERIAWLRAHRECWEPYRKDSRTIRTIHGMMQVAGLYSFNTPWTQSYWELKRQMQKANELCETSPPV